MKTIKFGAILIALASFSILNAQTELFFSIRMNNPTISDQIKSGNLVTTLPVSVGYSTVVSEYTSMESYQSKFGLIVSAGLQHPISAKFNLGFGFDFNMVNFSRTDGILQITSTNEATTQIGDPIVTFYGINSQTAGTNVSTVKSPEGNAKLYYLSIPASVHYKVINKLCVNMGLSLSVLAGSKQQLMVNSFRQLDVSDNINTTPIVISRWKPVNSDTQVLPRVDYQGDLTTLASSVQEVTNGSGLNRTLFMGNVGLSYNILHSIWLDFKYNFSFTPIYEERRQLSGKARYNFLEFGLKYDIKLPKKS